MPSIRTAGASRTTMMARRRGRAILAVAYALLLGSCESPFAPDNQTVERIEPNPIALTMTVGDARNVSVRVLDDAGKSLDGREVFWSSQNPAIATVTQGGLVTAVSQGNTQVAASAGGKSALVPVTINARPVTVVRVTPTSATILAGTTTQLAADPLDAGGQTVQGRIAIWSTSSAAVATVTSTGVVTGVAAGVANITATVDGVAGSSVVTVQPVPVASILLTPGTGSIIVGRSLQLAATPRDADNNPLAGRVITWSSNAPTVASVSSTGLVTALATGTATITATSEGKSATSRITVSLVPVDTVSVTPTTTSLAAGQTQQLTARIVDNAGNVLAGRAVTWNTDQPTIATVNSSGLVTALTGGRATITATSEGKSGTATINVTPVPVAFIDITPPSGTLTVGGTLQLTATTKDANRNTLPGRGITWISGAPSVATVTQAGLVTAVGTGSALIFAASEGVSTSVTITVSSVGVATVRMAPTSGSIAQGKSLQLTATPLDGQGNTITGRTVTWNSSAPAVASVSSTGLVTGIAQGTANITATIDGVVGTAPITVTPTPVASATIIPSAPTLTVGTTLGLTLLLADSSGAPLSPVGRNIGWAVSNQSIATVNNNGVVTAVAPGTVTVQATVESVIAQATVTVTNVPVASVNVTPSSAALQLGQKQALTAVARDASNNILTGRPVTWTSSDPTVATVANIATDTNTVTTVGTGNATIRATIGSASNVSTISVTSVPIASITVSPTPVSVEELKTTQLTATARDASNNILVGRTLVWSSSNNAVASVSQTGLVTANIPGTVTITASAPGQGAGGSNPTPGTSAVTVTFAPVAQATITPNNPTVTVGQTTQPVVTLTSQGGQTLSATGRTVTWSLVTSPAGAATINATTGVVTGVAAGTGTITVTASSPGQAVPVTATASLSISTVQIARVAFTPFTGTLHIGTPYARVVTATAFDAANNPLPGRLIVWSTENSGISLSVNSSTTGQVTITGNNTPATVKVYAQAQGASGPVTDSIAVPTDFVAIGPASTVALASAVADSVVPGGSNARTYTATPRDSAGNVVSGAALGGRTPTWSLSVGATFASLTPSGATATVTPNAPGAVTVQADWGTAQPTAALKILTPVNNILLTVAPTDSFFIGGNAAVVATARDAANSAIPGRLLTLVSGTPAAVTIGTGSGTQSISTTATGVSAPNGRAVVTLTAHVPFDNVSNSTTVKVLAPVSTIAVGPAGTDSIFVNGNLQATATLRDASGNTLTGRPITWSTSNALIATAAQSGIITGVAAGSANILADAEGKQGSKSLLVQEPVNSVAITTADSSVFVGQTQQVAVVLQDRFNATITGRPVTYSASPAGIVSISAGGLITAVAAGTANITATAEGKTSTAIPFVVSLVPVRTATVSSTQPPNVYPSHTFPAAVQAFDSVGGALGLTGRTIVWSSANPAIASVAPSNSGTPTITAVAVGTTTISATVDGVAATTPITVQVKPVPVASVTMAPSTANLQVGSSAFLFTPTPRDSTGAAITGHTYTFTWSASNAKATVNSSGSVTAVDSGAVSIIATATNQGTPTTPSPSGSSALTVSLIPIGSVTLTPSTLTLASTNASDSLVADVKAGSVSLPNRACTVVSSDTNILSVTFPTNASPVLSDALGQVGIKVKGVNPGTVTLTVTCDPGTPGQKVGTATITVP